MKKPGLIIFPFLIPLFLLAQGKEDFTRRLFEIKKKYMAIDREKNCQVKEIDDAEEIYGNALDNGASLTGYYRNDSLIKIVEWTGLSNKVIENKYYFEKGRLFFVSIKESKYGLNDSTQTIDHSKLTWVWSGKYYFENEKLFDVILSDKKHETTRQKDAAVFIADSKKFAKLLKEKKD